MLQDYRKIDIQKNILVAPNGMNNEVSLTTSQLGF